MATSKKYVKYSLHTKILASAKDNGFIALAMDDVPMDVLRRHLENLKSYGYVTISQDDIVNYYQQGTVLPDKSLFLMLEEGNRDTVLEIERILRDINYQATWMMYGDDLTDASFQDFVRQGYWEIGCHGYRCSYINEGTVWSNHFLMDYIRDRFGASVETESAMRERITQEYERMKHCFMKELGEVPRVYALLHSNTGQYGSQISVSDWSTEELMYMIEKDGQGR